MRTAVTIKTNAEMKAPSQGKSGLLIRLPIKKTYCTKCKKLVKGKAQYPDNSTRINCPKCGDSLWLWSQISWKALRNEAGSPD
jgi:hypothetical protein